jgi:hypothetical protein
MTESQNPARTVRGAEIKARRRIVKPTGRPPPCEASRHPNTPACPCVHEFAAASSHDRPTEFPATVFFLAPERTYPHQTNQRAGRHGETPGRRCAACVFGVQIRHRHPMHVSSNCTASHCGTSDRNSSPPHNAAGDTGQPRWGISGTRSTTRRGKRRLRKESHRRGKEQTVSRRSLDIPPLPHLNATTFHIHTAGG